MRSGLGVKLALAILFIIAISVVIIVWTQRARASVGNLQVYQGEADIIRRGLSVSGSTGDPIRLGDTVKSDTVSRVAIVLKDGSVIRLEAGAEVEVAELDYQGQKIKDAIFRLKFGRLWSRVAPLDPAGQFEVETPTAIAAVAGTSFNGDYLNRVTGFYVDRDQVIVSLKNRDKTLTAQKIATGLIIRLHDDQLDKDLVAGAEVPDPAFFDDWIRFNQAEDDTICQDRPLTPGCLEESPRFEAQQPSAPQPAPLPRPASTPTPPPATAPPVKPASQPAVLGVRSTQEANQQSTPQSTQSTASADSTPPSPTTAPVIEPPVSTNQSTPPSTSSPADPTDQSPPQPTPNPPPGSDPKPPPPPEKTLTSLLLSADRTQIFVNETVTLKTLAKYSDKSETDVSSQATWLVNQGAGRLSGNKFTATVAGEVKLSASWQSVTSNEVIVSVTASQIERLALTYSQPTPNQTVQFYATAHYNNGDTKDVTQEVTWQVKQPTEATISRAGLYSANGQLADTVTATLVDGNRQISVSTIINLDRSLNPSLDGPTANPNFPRLDQLPNNSLLAPQ